MIYGPELTRAVRRALYRLRWKLGRAWGDRVVLVGGLVPPLLVPDPASGVAPHVGTSDIDLAIGVFAPEEEAYVSLVKAVKDCGFRQRQPKEPSFRWFAFEDGIEVVLEILCPEDEEIQRRIHRKVEVDGGSELAALQVRGVELAGLDFVQVELSENVADLGDRGPINLRVVGPTTLLALKTQALVDVDKPKHAYELAGASKPVRPLARLRGSIPSLRPPPRSTAVCPARVPRVGSRRVDRHQRGDNHGHGHAGRRPLDRAARGPQPLLA